MKKIGALAAMALMVSPVQAAKEVLHPVQLGDESLRFDHGDSVVTRFGRNASVQIRTMPKDHGSLSFLIAVVNTGASPFNIDIANVRVEGAARPVGLLAYDEMVKRAKRRALVGSIASVVTGTAIGTVAGHELGIGYRNYLKSHWYQCLGCVEGFTVAGGAIGLGAGLDVANNIQRALDRSLMTYADQALRITTVFPGTSTGGRIYLTPFGTSGSDTLRLIVTIGDEQFAFGFRSARSDDPIPVFQPAAAETSQTSQPVEPAAPVAAQQAHYEALKRDLDPKMAADASDHWYGSAPASQSQIEPVISPTPTSAQQAYYEILTRRGVDPKRAAATANYWYGPIR